MLTLQAVHLSLAQTPPLTHQPVQVKSLIVYKQYAESLQAPPLFTAASVPTPRFQTVLLVWQQVQYPTVPHIIRMAPLLNAKSVNQVILPLLTNYHALLIRQTSTARNFVLVVHPAANVPLGIGLMARYVGRKVIRWSSPFLDYWSPIWCGCYNWRQKFKNFSGIRFWV